MLIYLSRITEFWQGVAIVISYFDELIHGTSIKYAILLKLFVKRFHVTIMMSTPVYLYCSPTHVWLQGILKM